MIAIFTFLKGILSWKMFLNAGLILEAIKLFNAIGNQIWREKKLPTCHESVKLLEITQKLVERGVIKKEGIPPEELALAVQNLKDEIECKMQ